MPQQVHRVRELLEYIVRTQAEIETVLGDDDFPVLAPPASLDGIARAEASVGLKFPPTYRELLEISNGVRHFSDEIDLFSVEDFQSAEYTSLVDEIRSIGWEIGDRLLVEGVIIAGQPGFRSIFLIDQAIDADAEGERPIVHWSDTELLRTATFREFLQKWCEVVDALLADSRDKARDTPPGIPIRRGPQSS